MSLPPIGTGVHLDIRVLLVEDVPVIARIVERMLMNSQHCLYHIEWRTTLAEALQALRQQDFDTILLDLNLPDAQGIDALHKELRGLRADEPTLNGLELRSVQALISYVAYSHSISEDCVLSLLNGHFETDSVEKIYQADFDSAVTFLVDLNPRVVMN